MQRRRGAVFKENVRRELISYSEQFWNLELTAPSNLLSHSKSSVTKTYDIFLQCIWSLFSELPNLFSEKM